MQFRPSQAVLSNQPVPFKRVAEVEAVVVEETVKAEVAVGEIVEAVEVTPAEEVGRVAAALLIRVAVVHHLPSIERHPLVVPMLRQGLMSIRDLVFKVGPGGESQFLENPQPPEPPTPTLGLVRLIREPERVSERTRQFARVQTSTQIFASILTPTSVVRTRLTGPRSIRTTSIATT